MPSSGDAVFVVENESQGKLIAARRKFQEENLKPMEQIMEGEHSLKIKFANRREKSRFYSGDKDFVKEKYDQAEEKLEKVLKFSFRKKSKI